ncbi:MAG: DUF1801 domain-containing protein [Tepidisphaerales bacterium]
MQSKATTVQQYLDQLRPDRRAAVAAVRGVILENLDADYEEGIQYGMIGYYVPHRVYPAGYHCDPKQPLPFAGLASQKNYLSLYLMSVYCGCGQGKPNAASEHARWFQEAWKQTGKKLDMGKACIRFKTVDDLALEVIGEAIRRVPAKKYIAFCEAARQTAGKAAARKPGKRQAGAAKSRK